MQVADIEVVRAVRREMARHQLDTSEVQVGASHGVIHLYGKVRPVRGQEDVFESEILALYKCLKQRAGIRDVVMEWDADGRGRLWK